MFGVARLQCQRLPQGVGGSGMVMREHWERFKSAEKSKAKTDANESGIQLLCVRSLHAYCPMQGTPVEYVAYTS